MIIAGIVLLIMQGISIVGTLLAGDSLFGDGNPFWLLGRYIFGIVGVILLVVNHVRKNKKGR